MSKEEEEEEEEGCCKHHLSPPLEEVSLTELTLRVGLEDGMINGLELI